MAMFSVDAAAAQRMIDYSGLQVCHYLPGRAIVVLTFMHYVDGDLDVLRIQHQRDARLPQEGPRALGLGRSLHSPHARH